ncbi:hypothetical protein G9A89_007152 [Geosiphon pyriformis]|nr:hypothetical protein G9A89_007152 [Geosiphon pyriformis]
MASSKRPEITDVELNVAFQSCEPHLTNFYQKHGQLINQELTMSILELISPSSMSRASNKPRPQNTYILFRKNHSRKQTLLLNSCRIVGDVSKESATLWQIVKENKELKKFWEDIGSLCILLHRALFPSYKYQPKSKSKKIDLEFSQEDKLQSDEVNKEKEILTETSQIVERQNRTGGNPGIGNTIRSTPKMRNLKFNKKKGKLPEIPTFSITNDRNHQGAIDSCGRSDIYEYNDNSIPISSSMTNVASSLSYARKQKGNYQSSEGAEFASTSNSNQTLLMQQLKVPNHLSSISKVSLNSNQEQKQSFRLNPLTNILPETQNIQENSYPFPLEIPFYPIGENQNFLINPNYDQFFEVLPESQGQVQAKAQYIFNYHQPSYIQNLQIPTEFTDSSFCQISPNLLPVDISPTTPSIFPSSNYLVFSSENHHTDNFNKKNFEQR